MPKKTFAAKVYVMNLDEAKQFYSEVLKLPLEDDGSADGYLVFTCPNKNTLLVERLEPTIYDRIQQKISSLEARASAITDYDWTKAAADATVEKELSDLKKKAKGVKKEIDKAKLVVEEKKKLLPAVVPSSKKNLPKRLKD